MAALDVKITKKTHLIKALFLKEGMKLLLNSKSFLKKSTFSNKKCPVIPEDLFKKTFVSNSKTFKGCIASQTYLDIKAFFNSKAVLFSTKFFLFKE